MCSKEVRKIDIRYIMLLSHPICPHLVAGSSAAILHHHGEKVSAWSTSAGQNQRQRNTVGGLFILEV